MMLIDKKYCLFNIINNVLGEHMDTLYFNKLEGKKVQCLLCPHNCLLKPSQKGICRVRKNINGQLITLNNNLISALNIDPIEKKPLYHFFPGTNTLSMACNGCNLKCLNCQNHSISQSSKSNYIEMSESQIIEKAKELKCNHITFTYTEPTVFYEKMLVIAKLAKKENIKCSIVSNGYINKEPLLELIPFIEAANIDLKFGSNFNYEKTTGGKVEHVVSTIKTLFENHIITEVTTLIIPTLNHSKEEFNKISDYLLNISNEIPWHLSAFYPTYKMLNYPPTNPETLIELREQAMKKRHQYVYTGNIINPEGETTFCPNCKTTLIKRGRLYLMENNIKNNNCPNCETKIYGKF